MSKNYNSSADEAAALQFPFLHWYYLHVEAAQRDDLWKQTISGEGFKAVNILKWFYV